SRTSKRRARCAPLTTVCWAATGAACSTPLKPRSPSRAGDERARGLAPSAPALARPSADLLLALAELLDRLEVRRDLRALLLEQLAQLVVGHRRQEVLLDRAERALVELLLVGEERLVDLVALLLAEVVDHLHHVLAQPLRVVTLDRGDVARLRGAIELGQRVAVILDHALGERLGGGAAEPIPRGRGVIHLPAVDHARQPDHLGLAQGLVAPEAALPIASAAVEHV